VIKIVEENEKMENKKGQGLTLTTIIVAALALIVLVVLVMVFTGRIGDFSSNHELDKCEHWNCEDGTISFDNFGNCNGECGNYISDYYVKNKTVCADVQYQEISYYDGKEYAKVRPPIYFVKESMIIGYSQDRVTQEQLQQAFNSLSEYYGEEVQIVYNNPENCLVNRKATHCDMNDMDYIWDCSEGQLVASTKGVECQVTDKFVEPSCRLRTFEEINCDGLLYYLLTDKVLVNGNIGLTQEQIFDIYVEKGCVQY